MGSKKDVTVSYFELASWACVLDAKLRLEKLKASRARDLLGKLADFVFLSHAPRANIKLSSFEK